MQLKEFTYLVIEISHGDEKRKFKHLVKTLTMPFLFGPEEEADLYLEQGSGGLGVSDNNLVLHLLENGTHFRGQSVRPITQGSSIVLTHGDVIQWGQTRLKFTFREPATAKFLSEHLGIREHLEQQYQHLSLIGSGGITSVYHTIPLEEQQPLALKILSLVDNPHLVRRFLHTASMGHVLSHPNLIKAYRRITEPQLKLYAVEMENCPGETLQYLLAARGRWNFERALPLFFSLLDVIGYLHEQEIIHCNINPANILIADTPKLLGMTLVKDEKNPLTYSEGTMLITPNFTAPEQIKFPAQVDYRADIFSLGAIWYTVLAGRPPFGNIRAKEYMRLLDKELTPSPLGEYAVDVPDEIVRLIHRMLALQPSQRPRTIQMIHDVLESITSD